MDLGEWLNQTKDRLEKEIPGVQLKVVANAGPELQPGLLVDSDNAVAAARWLRDTPGWQLDYLSNVNGVDWPELVSKEKVKVKKPVDGVEKEVEETVEKTRPGYLEVVYHLYSVARGQGPFILRLHTRNRTDQAVLPSLTPVWRAAELQEREVYDLFGCQFTGHPDLRRILMWDGFEDYPMRKDYVDPDDYEYEPTPHGEVLEKARRHHSRGEETQ
jgi:NADH-quinone oxidoreductase subunit C